MLMTTKPLQTLTSNNKLLSSFNADDVRNRNYLKVYIANTYKDNKKKINSLCWENSEYFPSMPVSLTENYHC